ncbi:hypothetical protein H2198_000314 [Neophaeococcomyces mojaviensis]|uniref:Uncharacterized protein n=1 Tax=Neophaeococcomyces mojaviensis TaxID=3383035 RepID=A0ACC3AKB1_9EURO|nr:hypothetical protein H2198_000314 [Knufia sp. JES_112]
MGRVDPSQGLPQSPTRKLADTNVAESTKTSKQSLKLSCDACARGKIKCPKQQPACERCVSRGRECIYSTAQRYGKKSRLTRQRESETDASILEVPSVAVSNGPPIPEPDLVHDALMPTSIPFEEYEVLAHPSVGALSIDSGESWPHSESLSSSDEWSGMDSMVPESLDLMLPGSDQSSQQFPGSLPDSPIRNTIGISHVPLHFDNSQNIAATTETMLPSEADNWTQSADHSAVDCFRKVCEAFQHLKRPQDTPCVYQSSQDMPYEDDVQTSMNISDVFTRTGEAMNTVSLVIQCPCHATTKVRCALTLLLFDIISWYEIVVASISQNTWSRRVSSAGSMCSSTTSADALISNAMDTSPTYDGPQVMGLSETHYALAQVILFKIRKIRSLMQNLSLPQTPAILKDQVLDKMAAELKLEMLRDSTTWSGVS